MARSAGLVGLQVGLLAFAATTTFVSADFMDENFVDTPSLNEVIPKPECDATNDVTVRFANTSQRLYLETTDNTTRGGCMTLERIWEIRDHKAPLYAIHPENQSVSDTVTGTWLLTMDLYVEDGITLQVHGSASGGTADTLLLLSTNDTIINLRAYGGSLDFENTKVVAWDITTMDYHQPESEFQPRSYISAISEIVLDESETCDGRAKQTMGEARMDIVSSEMAYLGYQDSEAYGLSWKVRGFCKDKSNPEVFDEVNVYGNIYDSEIHHLRFAVYTFGHEKGDWRRNTLHSNSAYGFDPHDDSDFITIHDNIVYDNNWHGIIASKRCNNVSIQGNTVYGGGYTSAGIFLHRSSDDAIVMNNNVFDNGDAGMAMLESSRALVTNNNFTNNKYGIRLSVGCADNKIEDNIFKNTSRYGLYTYQGSDLPDVMDSGRSQNNIFVGNTVIGGPQSIKFKESDHTTLIDNVFEDAVTVQFQNSTEIFVVDNTGLDDVEVKIQEESCFAEGSDSGYEPIC